MLDDEIWMDEREGFVQQVKELQTQLETVDKELSGVKQQKDDLTAAQETSAAQHQAQLAEAAEEKQQLGKQLEELQCKHDAAIKKAEQVHGL